LSLAELFEVARLYPEELDGEEFESKLKDECSSIVRKAVNDTARVKGACEALTARVSEV
jgi:hypothetical protein